MQGTKVLMGTSKISAVTQPAGFSLQKLSAMTGHRRDRVTPRRPGPTMAEEARTVMHSRLT
jgi:hypothetical protein